MRKLVSLGLLALMFSVFSSQALASNAEACDVLKKAQKGLHGLCVAWHNANEKNKGEIEAKFAIRAGYPITDIIGGGSGPEPDPNPNPPVTCPCWTTEILGSTVAGFAGQFCFSSPEYEVAVYAGGNLSAWAGATPFVSPDSVSGTECRLRLADGATVFAFETDADQDAVCREDVRTLQDSTDADGNYLFPTCY